MPRIASISTKVTQINRLAAKLKKLEGQRSRIGKAIAAAEKKLAYVFNGKATRRRKPGRRKKRKMSAAGLKNIRAAQKRRRAKENKGKK